jgi:hypothetical protein
MIMILFELITINNNSSTLQFFAWAENFEERLHVDGLVLLRVRNDFVEVFHRLEGHVKSSHQSENKNRLKIRKLF